MGVNWIQTVILLSNLVEKRDTNRLQIYLKDKHVLLRPGNDGKPA